MSQLCSLSPYRILNICLLEMRLLNYVLNSCFGTEFVTSATCELDTDARLADVAYKSVTGFLALATVFFGANLVVNASRGIAWHYSNANRTATVTERGVVEDRTIRDDEK